MEESSVTWVPAWFRAPGRVELPTGHHLRPLLPADRDLPVAGGRLLPGPGAHLVYGLFDDEERQVLGAVTLAPGRAPHDVEVVWWVGAADHHPLLTSALGAMLPGWVTRSWPFHAPRMTTG